MTSKYNNKLDPYMRHENSLFIFFSFILRHFDTRFSESTFVPLPLIRDLIQEYQEVLLFFLYVLPLLLRVLQLLCERFNLFFKAMQLRWLCVVSNDQIISYFQMTYPSM